MVLAGVFSCDMAGLIKIMHVALCVCVNPLLGACEFVYQMS